MATFTATDEEDGVPAVDFTPGSNDAGYYAINGNNVVLTAAGAAFVQGGGILPAVNLTATDSGTPALTDNDSATPSVIAQNDAPVAVNDGPIAVTEDTAATGNVLGNDSDPENDALSVTQFTVAGDATVYSAGSTATIAGVGSLVINANGSFTFTPATNYTGPVPTATYTVSDGSLSDSAELSFADVSPVNDAPVAIDDINAIQPTAAPLYYADNQGNVGVLDPTTGARTPIGNAGQVFTDIAVDATGKLFGITFTSLYSINPLTGASSHVGTFGGSVNALVGSPDGRLFAAGNDGTLFEISTTTGAATTLGSFGATSAGDLLFADNALYLSSSAGSIVKFDLSSNSVSTVISGLPATLYNLAQTANGTYASTADGQIYLIDLDSGVATNTGVVSSGAQIWGFATAPVVDSIVTITGDVTPGTVGQDYDVDGTTFTVTGIAAGSPSTAPNSGVGTVINGTYGTLTLAADGSYSYSLNSALAAVKNLAAGQVGNDVFTYRITDADGATDTATLTIRVTGNNDAPIAVNDGPIAVTEDTPATGNVLSNDSDADAGSTLTVQSFTIAGSSTVYNAGSTATITGVGSLVINANGSFTFTPAANYTGPVPSATYTVSDGSLIDIAELSFANVSAVNDAPISQADLDLVIEGSNSLRSSVLTNDGDIEGSGLTVAFVATNASGAAVAVDGVHSISTALGGTVIMNSDGTFRYIAPVVSHNAANTPVADNFVYRASDGSDAGSWTTVTINLSDSTPVAANDSASVAFNETVSGSLLSNDRGVDGPLSITQFSFGGTTVTVPAGGSNSINTPDGLLTVSSNGSYSYQSQLSSTAVLTGSSLATWESSTNLYGFTNTDWQGAGTALNISALNSAAQGKATYVNGSKDGIGVSGGGSTLGLGEQLIVQLLETTTAATIGIAQLNTNQNSANAHWYAYDANGNQVSSGTFANAASISSGTEYTLDISSSSPFTYVRLEWDNTSNGFVLSSLDISRLPQNHTESFSYTLSDADGDTSSATLTITPGATSVAPSTQIAGTNSGETLSGTSGNDNISGLDGDDALRGFAGDDTLSGGAGVDYLDGGSGNDSLIGDSGNDILIGDSGNDILLGGSGNDALTGGSGADLFIWKAGDTGNDVIKDFNAGEGDRIDLSDLLSGMDDSADLSQYLGLDTATSTLLISTTGTLATGADVTIKVENAGVNVLTASDTINSLIAGGDSALVKVNPD
ncbi:hypothetical protein PSEUDO8AS_40114 [Pseudomonas sp. 8AS]|nr:hypothetical protein PSEUDO8AS_40114 [Pseudomonas sp. 8AS]